MFMLSPFCVKSALWMHNNTEYILDGYKHWFYLGIRNYICFLFLDVHKFFFNKKIYIYIFPKKCSRQHHLCLDVFIAWVNQAKGPVNHLPSLLSTTASHPDSSQCTGSLLWYASGPAYLPHPRRSRSGLPGTQKSVLSTGIHTISDWETPVYLSSHYISLFPQILS